MLDLSTARALPLSLRASVEPRFIDAMGHMNVAWYVHLFDRAVWVFFDGHGLDPESRRRANTGVFAVEEHLRYLAELREGDPLEVHTGVLEVRPKTLRLRQYMVDPARERVSAVREVVAVHIDFGTRRSAPFSADTSALLRAALCRPPAGEPLDEASAQQWARDWIEAWNRRDVEAVLARFAEEAVFFSPKAEAVMGKPRVGNKAELRAYWLQAIARIGTLHFTLDQAIWSASAQALTILYRTAVDAQPARRAAEVLHFQGDRVVRGEGLYGALAEAPATP
jgi:acyl-CoA thioester hydrolase